MQNSSSQWSLDDVGSIEQPCSNSSSPSRDSACFASVPPSPALQSDVPVPGTKQAWLPNIAVSTSGITQAGPSSSQQLSAEPICLHHPVTSLHPTPTSSCNTTPLAHGTATYFNHSFTLPTMDSSSDSNGGSVRLRLRTKPWLPCSSSPTTPSSACSTPLVAHHAESSPLLILPDQLLTDIWSLLDSYSRAALYHTCRALWTNPTLNALLTTCSCNTLDDLLTWPRHAGSPKRLRLVNGHPSRQAPPPTPEEHHPSPYADESGDRSFELLLSAAREHPKALEVLSGVTHVIMQGRGKGSELCKRLAWLLGPLCPRLSKLLVDWCAMGGETCAAASCWLPGLTHLTLHAVNSMELRGTWPQPLLTYSDLAGLTALTHLELIDCHLPFLELGVQDITPLSSLVHLRSLHLVYSSTEHDWPGSKPCYLLLGLSDVSHGCPLLSELVLDGVQHAKMGPTPPSWPSLTDLAVGYLSGWHPSLVTGLGLNAAAPILRNLSLGKLVCNGHSTEAKQLFISRCTSAMSSLSLSRVTPSHLEIYVPPLYTDQLALSNVFTSLRPLHSFLVSLALHVDGVIPGDGPVLRQAAPLLRRLHLTVRHACGTGIADVVESLPSLSHFQLECEADAGHVGAAATDGNVLSACYAALSAARDGPFTMVVRHASVFATLCMREMRHIKAASGHPVVFTTTW